MKSGTYTSNFTSAIPALLDRMIVRKNGQGYYWRLLRYWIHASEKRYRVSRRRHLDKTRVLHHKIEGSRDEEAAIHLSKWTTLRDREMASAEERTSSSGCFTEIQVPDGNKCGRKLVDKEMTCIEQITRRRPRPKIDDEIIIHWHDEWDPKMRDDGSHEDSHRRIV